MLRDRARQRQAPRPPGAGQALPRRPRGRAGSSTTRRSRRRSPPQRPTASGSRRTSCHFADLARTDRAARSTSRCARCSSRSATRRRTCASCSRRWPSAARSRSARWATTPRWPCSRDQRPPLFSYFKQLFAQVTNPPIDPIRESIVMSLATGVGAEGNLLDETPEHARQLVDDAADPAQPRARDAAHVDHPWFRSHTIDITWPVAEGPDGLMTRLTEVCDEAHDAIAAGVNILILSDRAVGAGPLRDPVAAGGRRRPPPPRARGHAPADRPRARVRRAARGPPLRDADRLRRQRDQPVPDVRDRSTSSSPRAASPASTTSTRRRARTVKGIGKGLLKTISKMGISTIQSYNGAQIFEAVGLEPALVDRHFTGTASRIGGIGLDVLAQEALDRHARGFGRGRRRRGPAAGRRRLRLAPRRRAPHVEPGDDRGAAARRPRADGDAPDKYGEYARAGQRGRDPQGDAARPAASSATDVEPVPLDEVEPATEIVKRFATGAMSLGSISTEAHETLAIAMNRLGGQSNTGEGGEDPRRFTPDANGDRRRSAIKQVASGRFGVTIHYLVNADQLQIKMAQGAKPGEGGQLPGHKVDQYIGSVRHTTPGVGLISPPPHHDIYSIEDLKQLIYDLRCANPQRAGLGQARVRGRRRHGRRRRGQGQRRPRPDRRPRRRHRRVAAVARSSAAGVPVGDRPGRDPADAAQERPAPRIVVQTDGQLKTGRDVAIAALLGADEMGFSTAPLIATGCIMMRACHLNTCPVGIATQDPELRKRFEGQPEHVVNFFFFVAEEVREIMASLGIAHVRRPDRPRRPARGRRRDRPLEGARDRPDAPAHASRATSTPTRRRAAGSSRRRRCSTTTSTTS